MNEEQTESAGDEFARAVRTLELATTREREARLGWDRAVRERREAEQVYKMARARFDRDMERAGCGTRPEDAVADVEDAFRKRFMSDEPRIYRVDDPGETTWVVATSPEEAIKCAESFLPLDSVYVSEETDLDGRGVTLDDGTTRTLREELAADPTPRIVCGTWTT